MNSYRVNAFPSPKTSRFPKYLAPVFALWLAVAPSGCTSTWWAEVKANPVQTASQLAEYVQVFLSTATTVWQVISPLIATSQQPQANKDFSDAVAALNGALTVYQDAVRAAAAAEQPNPDFSALISNVEDAASKVMAVVAQFRQPAATGLTGADYDMLSHQASVIAAWPKR